MLDLFPFEAQQTRAIENDKERAEFVDECGGDWRDQSYAGEHDGGGDENETAQHVLIDDAQRFVRERKKMRDATKITRH
jgi:hypothetical protein